MALVHPNSSGACGPLDGAGFVVPLWGVLAALLCSTLSFLGVGLAGVALFGVWWFFLWLGPAVVLFVAYRGEPVVRGLVLLVFLGGALVERWAAHSWWFAFVFVGIVFVVAALRLQLRWNGSAAALVLVVALPLLAFASLADSAKGDGFWRKCWSLRAGMSVEEVARVMDGAYVWDEAVVSKRRVVEEGDLPPSGRILLWPSGSSADECTCVFRAGRLVGIGISRD